MYQKLHASIHSQNFGKTPARTRSPRRDRATRATSLAALRPDNASSAVPDHTAGHTIDAVWRA